ncbi:MAG: hypothetical protein K2J12_10635, partial [Muribaculaceae bacterium]|nr:hypothetical protein [Muribaculaceae bacterium]
RKHLRSRVRGQTSLDSNRSSSLNLSVAKITLIPHITVDASKSLTVSGYSRRKISLFYFEKRGERYKFALTKLLVNIDKYICL